MFLLLEPDHVAGVLAPVIEGQSVEVRLCLGEKKASPQTLRLLEEEADLIGAVVKDGDRHPSCWRLVESGLPPNSAPVAAITP